MNLIAKYAQASHVVLNRVKNALEPLLSAKFCV
jgi:hypothetical protein